MRSLQAYERGIALFRWPNVYDIWNTYLTKFIDRYGGKKLERARDLFEQALDGCPAKFAKSKGLCCLRDFRTFLCLMHVYDVLHALSVMQK